MNKDDWRLMGQERYLKEKELYFKNYKASENDDHDHCEFCSDKFISKEQKGYCTTDYYYWICPQCYKDFKELFNWEIIQEKV